MINCLCQNLLGWELLGSMKCQEGSPGVLNVVTNMCGESEGLLQGSGLVVG